MTSSPIAMMLQQHAYSRDLERIAKHYDDQVVEACRQRDVAIRRAEEAEGQLAIKDAHAQALLAQCRAFAAAYPDSPLLQKTGRIKGNGQPETVLNQKFYNPVFDAIIHELGFGDPLEYRI